MADLRLAPGRPRTLAFVEGARKDLRLLELDEALLQELLQSGCGRGGEGGWRLSARLCRVPCASPSSGRRHSEVLGLPQATAQGGGGRGGGALLPGGDVLGQGG